MRHKKGKTKSWYPFWITKWLFGTSRHELIIKIGDEFQDYRGIYIDLLTLSKLDDGYIRANETTPYPLEQLSGLFCVPVDKLKKCIELCLSPEVAKLEETSPGIYYITSTPDYDLTESYKYRKMKKNEDCSQIDVQCSKNSEPIIEYNRIENNKTDNNIHPLNTFIQKSLTHVAKLETQMTTEQCDELIRFYGKVKVRAILESMENYSKIKKYNSAYLTAKKWLEKEHGKVKSTTCGFCKQKLLESELAAHFKDCAKNPKNNIIIKDVAPNITNLLDEIPSKKYR